MRDKIEVDNVKGNDVVKHKTKEGNERIVIIVDNQELMEGGDDEDKENEQSNKGDDVEFKKYFLGSPDPYDGHH